MRASSAIWFFIEVALASWASAAGYFWKGTTVSPDGCKIAFRRARSSKDEALGYQAWKAGGVGEHAAHD